LWNEVVKECIHSPGGFKSMFEWDTRKGGQNRITTIAECIGAGLVPGLALVQGVRGITEEVIVV
jgi:hypothetical protein